MELTTDNLFALDMLKNSDLYDPLPVQRIARDVATHAELFTRIHLISVESKRCLSFGDDQPFPDSAPVLSLSVTLSGVDDLAAIEIMKGWSPPMISDAELFGQQTVQLTWPTGREWAKFKADLAALQAAE